MKNYLLIAAFVLFIGSSVNAQDVYKQQGGEKNVEVLFSPLGGSPIGINGIKYRSFTSATSAWRANVFIGFNNDSDVMLGGGNDGMGELNSSSSEFTIAIAPGIERHFAGTDRLTPYYGGEAVISFMRMTDKMEYNSAGDTEEITTKNGSFGFGLNGIFGADYYFADNIYIGFELGFGFQFTSESDTVIEDSAEGAEDVESPNGSSINLGPNAVGQIRAGVLF